MNDNPWLTIERGAAPLIVSIPHAGVDLGAIESRLVSPWTARIDADWWLAELYGFARDLDATIVRTALSRTVIDVNRDPSGVSLYPGQATTDLCPTTTFDGAPLYRDGAAPDAAEIAVRKAAFFDPYHAALRDEAARLRQSFARVALYDCHSIRSVIPRLFTGMLPIFNLGSNAGQSADPALIERIVRRVAGWGQPHVLDGRFKGGWITRGHGDPARGLHAIQMELACRSYMREPASPLTPDTWPSAYDPAFAAPTQGLLRDLLFDIRAWALEGGACSPSGDPEGLPL